MDEMETYDDERFALVHVFGAAFDGRHGGRAIHN